VPTPSVYAQLNRQIRLPTDTPLTLSFWTSGSEPKIQREPRVSAWVLFVVVTHLVATGGGAVVVAMGAPPIIMPPPQELQPLL
jgi:hypothetical protein